MTSAQTDVKEYSYFADNRWRKAVDNQVFEVHEPYSGKLFARVVAASRADARAAVDAAAKAFAEWAETTPAEKARLFLKAAEIVKRRRSEIAEVLARETGSIISFATFQQDLVAATLQQVAGWVYLPKGEVLETNLPGTYSIGMRRPLGVVASFTPWNGANVLSWRAVISPVAAGNTVAREYFMRADQGRPDILELFQEDVEVYFPKFGLGFGRNSFLEMVKGFEGALQYIQHDYDRLNFIPSGDYLVVEGTSQGRMSGKSWAGGTTPGGRFCNVFKFRDGRISRLHIFLDPDYTSEDEVRFRWGKNRQW